jgi:hypothetical protein
MESRDKKSNIIHVKTKYQMPEHGDIEKETKKIYCGYWMTIEEWEDIHNYSINEKFEVSSSD